MTSQEITIQAGKHQLSGRWRPVEFGLSEKTLNCRNSRRQLYIEVL